MAQQLLHTYDAGKAKMSFYQLGGTRNFLAKIDSEEHETATSQILFDHNNACNITIEIRPRYQNQPQYDIETQGFEIFLIFCAWCLNEQGFQEIRVTYPDRLAGIVTEALSEESENVDNIASLQFNSLSSLGQARGFFDQLVDVEY
jgi:hypothetical protein